MCGQTWVMLGLQQVLIYIECKYEHMKDKNYGQNMIVKNTKITLLGSKQTWGMPPTKGKKLEINGCKSEL